MVRPCSKIYCGPDLRRRESLRHSLKRGRHLASGMTLVEIMVTLIISSILAASTFLFFAGQQRIYETQTKLLNIQQNVWAALEVVSRYVRASGSGMYECVRPASYANATLGGAARLASSNPSSGPLSDSLASRPQAGIRAYNVTTGQMQWIPPLWIVNNSTSDAGVVASTDILTTAFGTNTSGTDIDATLLLDFANTSPTTTLTLVGTNTGSMFRAGEFILLLVSPDWGYANDPAVDRGCTLFQITSNPMNTTILPHAAVPYSTGGIVWNPSGNVPNMLPGTGYSGTKAGVRNLGQLTWVRFFIAKSAAGIPQLMMQRLDQSGSLAGAQVLAEGIEDFQVSFACDTGTLGTHTLDGLNGNLDEGTSDAARKTDEWWNNVPSDTLPPATSNGFCNLPTAVRMTLVARTLLPDDLIDPAVTGNGPVDVEDHRYSPRLGDQYRRRVLSTTVYPRNNKPL